MKYSINTYYLDYPLISGRVFDVFTPEKISKDTAIFIVHGGGWRGGSRQSFHKIMEAFCERGYMVASTDYRLYAKNAFEQLSDIRAAYDRFVSILKELNMPLKIAVYGESAGAHLAALLTLAKPDEAGEKNQLKNEWVKPIKAMLQATPIDFVPFESMIPSIKDAMIGIAGDSVENAPEIYERLSPRKYIRKDNPPVFFMEAEYENVFYSKHTKVVYQKHRELGIDSKWKIYEGVEHGFFFNLDRIAQRQALQDICDFIEGNFN